jgi:HK97 family phage major capsid protein
MNATQLRELAHNKALEAQALLEAEQPTEEDAKKADGLLTEAEKLRVRAEKIEKALTYKEPEKAPKATEGLVVVEDEEDRQKAVKTWAIGDFFAALALEPEKLRMYRSKDEPEHYNLSEAIGPKAVGSLGAAKAASFSKQSGMSEGNPAAGGFLVDVQHNYNIMSRVYNTGELLRRADMVGLGPNSNGMTFLRDAETSRANGSRRGGVRYYWVPEGGEKTASYPTFTRQQLNLNKIVVMVYATDELLQDASALEGYIMQVAPEEIRFGVEDAMIRGTGGGQPQGILGAPCLVTQNAEAAQAADTIVSQNVINMWSRRWPGARDYVWMVNPDCIPALIQMNLGVGTGGSLVYMPPGGLSGAPYGSLFGRPVIESEYCDTIGDVGDIILASWSEYQMIEKGGVQSASSIHVRFVYDESVLIEAPLAA